MLSLCSLPPSSPSSSSSSSSCLSCTPSPPSPFLSLNRSPLSRDKRRFACKRAYLGHMDTDAHPSHSNMTRADETPVVYNSCPRVEGSGANLQTDLSGCRMSAALQASHPRPDLCGLCVIRERRTETRPKPNQTQPHFGQKSLNPHICSSAFSISVTSKRTFLLLLTLFFCTFPDEDAKRLATQSKSV